MLSTATPKKGGAYRFRPASILSWITRHYTRQALWSLFLMCAFPQHVWTLILAFRDISWVTARSNNGWDAVGVISYGLLFALVESLLLFGGMVLLGFLVSGRWDVGRRVALLTTLVLVASIWAMLEQLFFLAGTGLPGWLIGFVLWSGHPLRTLYFLLGGLVGVTTLLPVMLVIRSARAWSFMRVLIDRLSVLTMFYLALDVLAILIVIVRNL